MADAQGDSAQPWAATKPTAIIARAIRWEYGQLSRLMTSRGPKLHESTPQAFKTRAKTPSEELRAMASAIAVTVMVEILEAL